MPDLDPTVEKAYQLDRAGRVIKVTVVVKTTPTPSDKHEETVCVAGIAHDPYRWVRLYPIRFRDLKHAEQFKKYETICVPVRSPSSDARQESLRIDGSPEVVDNFYKNWNKRAELLAQFPPVTLCGLRRGIKNNANNQSLAVVRPRDSIKLNVDEHGEWTERERRIIAKWNQPTLDDDEFKPSRTPLEPPRFRVHVNFKCRDENTCKGHSISLTDWEGTALQRRFPDDASIDYARKQFTRKFVTEKFKANKVTQIIVGNQAQGNKRASFLALGLFGPYDEPQPTLF